MRSPIVLALAVVIVSARAGAQDARAWEVDHLATLDAATVALVVPASTDGAPTRIRVRGTIDSTLDGAELDAVSVRHGGALDHALGAPLVLSPGAEVVQSDAALHRYVIEAPPGSEVEVVDFGSNTGTVFAVKGEAGEPLAVVWLSDEGSEEL